MGWIIGFLTVVLVLDCMFLILLILVQLPKKEAGIGQAFGASATDALFGAGSGTALTKMTKYATGIFLGLTLLLTVLNAGYARNKGRSFEEQLNQARSTAPAALPEATVPTNVVLTTATNLATTASNLLSTAGSNAASALTTLTNPPTNPGTNPAPAPQ